MTDSIMARPSDDAGARPQADRAGGLRPESEVSALPGAHPSRKERIRVLSERLLAEMRRVALQEGWGIAVHGSMTRDLDIVAVPWIENASFTPAFVEAMRAAVAREICGAAVIGAGEDGRTSGYKQKPQGRRCYTIHGISERMVEDEQGCHPYVDLSVMDFRISDVAQAFGDGVYVACSALENTDRMADDLIASSWPDYERNYRLVSDSDGNPKGGDGTAPWRSDDSAGRDSGIAQDQVPS